MSLLDVGCGPGSITVGLAAAVAPGPTTAVDVDVSRMTHLDGLTVIEADVLDLPFPDASFDAVFASMLLQHLADPLATSPRVGKHLRGLLRQASFKRCVAGATALNSGTADEIHAFGQSQAGFFSNPAFVAKASESGWSSSVEMTEISAAWQTWAADPGAFLARFNCHAVAWA